MDTLRHSIVRAQLSKPLPTGREKSGAAPAAGLAAIHARFSAVDKKLDTLIHMLKGPSEDHGAPGYLLAADVRRVVATFFDVTEQDMDRLGRSAKIARIRQIGYYLCRSHTTRSLHEIGRIFGHRDHTTVLHGVRKIGALRKTDAALDGDLSKLETRLAEMLARRGAA